MRRRRPIHSVTWVLGVTACSAPPTRYEAEADGFPAPAPASEDSSASERHVPAGGAEPSGASSASAPASQSANAGVVLEPDDTILEEDALLEAAPEPSLEHCSEGVPGTDETRALMEPFVVEHGSFVRRTLYSWTVPEQIEELRNEPTLLTRATSSSGERGRAADLILEQRQTDEISALLSESRFEKRRFGWANPWATVLGFTGEGYGDRLLAITLKEEAIVGRMLATRQGVIEWTFQTLTGEPVDHETLLGSSERLAAIYFVDERDPAFCHSTVSSLGSVMREFFVLNEAMVEGWSAFTPELEAEVARGIEALGALESALLGRACFEPDSPEALSPTCWRERVLDVWSDPAPRASSLLGLYEASLAFPNDLYLPRRDNLRRLIETLELVPFDEEPLIHVATR